MMVKIPASAYLRGPIQELWYGENDSLESRVFYYAIGDGEQMVEPEGVFSGVHGPRFSPKPVYHLKPVGESPDGGLYTVDGKVAESYVQSQYMGGCLRSLSTGGYVVVSNMHDFQTTSANSTLTEVRVDFECGTKFKGRNGTYYATWAYFNLRLYPDGRITQTRSISDTKWRSIISTMTKDLGLSWQYCRYLGLRRRDYADTQPQARRLISSELCKLVDTVTSLLDQALSDWSRPGDTTKYPFPAHAVTRASLVKPVDLFHDQDRFNGDPVFDLTNYWVDYGRQHAFVEAVESVPRMNDNNISNILEFTSFIYSLVVRHEVQIPHSLQDAWLAYRYSYNTTKLDAKEAIAFMRRHAQKYLNGFGLRSYGQCTFEYEGISVKVRCSVRIRNKQLDTIDRIWRALDTYGLRPNFYIVWDSIPFSFIADWFLPIGDVLSVADVRQRVAEYYTFHGITYSWEYYTMRDGIRWKSYRRWVESAPPELSGVYWLEDGNTSPKLAAYRALDLASLILG